MVIFRMISLWTLAVLVCGLAACSAKDAPRLPRHQAAAVDELVTGNTWYMRGCYDKAAESFEKALERFAACDDQGGVAKTLNNLGALYRATQDPATALSCFDEAERLFARLGLRSDRIQALSNAAAAHMDLKQPDRAGALLDQAEILARAAGLAQPTLLSHRALWLIDQDRIAEADPLMVQALALCSPDRPFEYAVISHAVGRLMETKGDLDQAIRYYLQALDTDRNANAVRGIAADLTALGRVHLAMNQYETAADYLYRSLAVQTLVGDADNARVVSDLLKTSLTAQGDAAQPRPVTDHFLKQWAGGAVISGPCD
ncbi:hypothetical protein JCM14469_22890 [Desulfatiferula olefinivorans]